LARGLRDGEYLDGECYAPNKTFEEITSMFKMNPESLEFHVFDYFDTRRPNLTFEERMKHITVDTFLVKEKKEVQGYHDMFVQQGHEGIMIRDAASTYEIGKRSNYLLKYKAFQTEEYPIVDVKEGSGREKGTAIWICKTGEQHFSVKPEGTLEKRREYLDEKEKYVGKHLTVRFQNLTALGVPRFPVGVAVRDYE
jgi:DNA ligase-1